MLDTKVNFVVHKYFFKFHSEEGFIIGVINKMNEPAVTQPL